MSRSLGLVAGLVAAVSLLAGCGGGNGSCGGGACGGNLVGTWRIVSVCNGVDPSASSGTCIATVDSSGVRETGTITFNTDGTYSTSLMISGSVTESIDSTCLSGTTCEQENANFAADVTSGVYSSASCATAGSACRCQLVYANRTLAGTGVWTTSGTSVTIAAAGSSTGTADSYCVIGSSLTISSMPMPGLTSMSTITLTRG